MTHISQATSWLAFNQRQFVYFIMKIIALIIIAISTITADF